MPFSIISHPEIGQAVETIFVEQEGLFILHNQHYGC